jgi:hypothetical protein
MCGGLIPKSVAKRRHRRTSVIGGEMMTDEMTDKAAATQSNRRAARRGRFE